MRSDTFNSHVYRVRTQIIVTQYIPILHIFALNESESKGTIANENLLQVCSTYKSKSESVIVNESSTNKSESESVHKIINTNKEKDTIDET